jgi:hypothetical protein
MFKFLLKWWIRIMAVLWGIALIVVAISYFNYKCNSSKPLNLFKLADEPTSSGHSKRDLNESIIGTWLNTMNNDTVLAP